VLDLPPIIDMHTHIWSGSAAADGNTLIEMADRFELQAVVVMPLFGGTCPSPGEISAGNKAVAALAQRDPRIKPMVTVYPRHGQFAIDEMNRWMDGGFVGLKIWVSIADEPCVFPLIEGMIERHRPTLIHAMHKSVGQLPLESDPKNIAKLARRYPQAKIIMPHIGGNFYYSCDAIADCTNVWTDPSGTYCESGMVEHAVKVLGAQRIMFGSDAPGADFMNNVAKVASASISDADRRAIFAGNAQRLWNWS
jgi:predicted TIM-barrel fold metal-dependent hydrolase